MTAHSQTLASLPLGTRLWFAFAAFFRVLFDGAAAADIWTALHPNEAAAALPSAPEPAKLAASPKKPDHGAALQLLGLLQREGRLIDFLEQDIASFGDADIGAAVRVVHEGCRRALEGHVKVAPIRSEEEGAKVTIAALNPDEITLTGNVGGTGPYTGVLRHRGWRATLLTLPEALAGHDANVLAAAEVEL